MHPQAGSKHAVAWVVDSISLAYGGVGRTVLRAAKTEAFLTGKEWTPANIEAAYSSLAKDFPLPPQVLLSLYIQNEPSSPLALASVEICVCRPRAVRLSTVSR